ncbi:MAG: DUF2029 domain-containing protein [Chloroflexi bacterium]|nr:DUF2029 domain-containing protein [Chloroflexota bacterium]
MIATRPAELPDDQRRAGVSKAHPRWAGIVSVVLRLLLLALAGVVVQIGWVMVWTLSYRLTHGNDFTYVYLVTQSVVWDHLRDLLALANTLAPGLEGPDGPVSLEIVVNSLVLAFVVTSVGYVAGVVLVDVGISAVRGALAVVVLFELLFQVTLFLSPGLFTTDIFSYVMYGHISAVYNLNPYIYPPNYFPGNPMLNWIHPIWWDQPSVYGPLWTNLAWVLAHLMDPLNGLTVTLDDGEVLQVGLMDQVFVYKLAMNVVQLINLALLWWLLGRLMPQRPRARLTAFTMFAWNPLMLFDTAGNAHNDALMVTLLLLGVVPLTLQRRVTNVGWAVGTFFVGLSALIKYTTCIVGLFYVVPWVRRLATWPSRIGWIGGTGLVIAATAAILFVPWWDYPRSLQPILTAADGKSWQFSNSAPDVFALEFDNKFLNKSTPAPSPDEVAYSYAELYTTPTLPTVRIWTKWITRGIFALYLIWECIRLWRIAGDRRRSLIEPILEASVRAFAVLIVLVLPWVLEWYWFWPLALATLLGWRRQLSLVIVGYTLTSLPIFYVHHYWNWHMPSMLVLVYAFAPLAVPVIGWLWRLLRRARPQVPVNARLRPGLGLE